MKGTAKAQRPHQAKGGRRRPRGNAGTAAGDDGSCGVVVPDDLYCTLVRLCARNIRYNGARHVTDGDAARFPTLSYDTILTVFRQQYQRHILRTSHLHRQPQVRRHSYHAAGPLVVCVLLLL